MGMDGSSIRRRLASDLLHGLETRGVKLACAESLTGGLLADALVRIPQHMLGHLRILRIFKHIRRIPHLHGPQKQPLGVQIRQVGKHRIVCVRQ